MKFTAEPGVIETYRVNWRLSRRRRFGSRTWRHPWSRTWQAEWVNPSTGDYCPRAPLAWTEAGVLRKARRWYRRQNTGPAS